MSEGELHKKIREKAREDYHCDLGKVVDCLLVKADFFEVLAEAKREYPGWETIKDMASWVSGSYLAELLGTKRDEWFERWFGKAGADVGKAQTKKD